RVWLTLAAQQLADGARLRDRVSRALRDGEITARSIGFEVTESSLLEDLPGAVELLSSFRELGIEIALDDFGTGDSSLTYLRRPPCAACPSLPSRSTAASSRASVDRSPTRPSSKP